MGQIASIRIDYHFRHRLILPCRQFFQFDFVFHKCLPGIKIARQRFAGDYLSVYNCRWRSGQAKSRGFLFRAGHVFGISSAVQFRCELIDIKTYLFSQSDEEISRGRRVQGTPVCLALEQQIVILPELSLCPGRFRRFGRFLGIGMNTVQRKVTINYLDIIGVSVYQTL